jgi:hypothetical protein
VFDVTDLEANHRLLWSRQEHDSSKWGVLTLPEAAGYIPALQVAQKG